MKKYAKGVNKKVESTQQPKDRTQQVSSVWLSTNEKNFLWERQNDIKGGTAK